MPEPDAVEAFITRWENAGAGERSNYQLFLTELCDVIGVAKPELTAATPDDDAYVFERGVPRVQPDGASTTVHIDLYKRGCLVLEAKQGANPLRVGRSRSAGEPLSLFAENQLAAATSRTGHGRRGTEGFDKAMKAAYHQARHYIRDLPPAEGRPPFLITVDVGHCIRLYSEFTCTGGNYVAFPDPNTYRIYLEDLRLDAVRDRLRAVWTDPLALDPAKHAARVTREIADRLARLAKTFEAGGHDPEVVARFLMRLMFTMFAEDIGLLQKRCFTDLLESMRGHEAGLPVMLKNLWDDMRKGADFSVALKQKILHFNGGLFEDTTALPVNADQLQLLIEAAHADWRDVEPAIFGTLLERALDPRERHKLGAHYTPRSYVERLVKPTIMDPLMEQYLDAEAAAAQLLEQGKNPEALETLHAFHHQLCQIRVLDPACGSGNFLYVTMEHMKRLEGQLLRTLEDLGDPDLTLEMGQFKVRPHQFLGLEINPRAVPIAELVLWIGYLQWQRRNTPADKPIPVDDPVISQQHSITHQDAVLAYDEKIPLKDADGKVVTLWDGRTTKPHPVTGNEVPDETARKTVFEYINPRRAEWPKADYIVGNPPFVGNKQMRDALGDGYVSALRTAFDEHNSRAWDFVMFWWHQAAELLTNNRIRRFGLITTNSIHQTFNRRCTEPFLTSEKTPIALDYAIPDHPWVDSSDGAAVRIAMTVATPGPSVGELVEIAFETGTEAIEFTSATGLISSKLQTGPSLTSAHTLLGNEKVSFQGCKLVGSGFQIDLQMRQNFVARQTDIASRLPAYYAGRDLTRRWNERYVIDLTGLNEATAKAKFPEAFQHLFNTVKPERNHCKRKAHREKWWLFGEKRTSFPAAMVGQRRYIATSEVAKHRTFVFLTWPETLPYGSLIAIASDDSSILGLVSSTLHVQWALAQGGLMGMGNDPRYNNSRCFETFPFPALPEQTAAVRDALQSFSAPATAADLAKFFTRANKSRIEEILQTLVTLGRAVMDDDGMTFTLPR